MDPSTEPEVVKYDAGLVDCYDLCPELRPRATDVDLLESVTDSEVQAQIEAATAQT